MNTETIFKYSLLLSVITYSLLTTGCVNDNSGSKGKQDELHGSISISGAFALYPMTVRWAEEFMKDNPGTRIDISAGGAGKGMTDALSGMVDLGMFSREIAPPEIEKGAWYIAVTKDAVLATINGENPVVEQIFKKGMTKKDFQELFLNEEAHYWEQYFPGDAKSRINVYTRSDACGAAEIWGKYLDRNQESLLGVGVYGDPGMADAIKNDTYGIGYNNVVYAYDMHTRQKYDGLEIVPLDIDENGKIDPSEDFYGTLDKIMNAIGSGAYPSPPSRELYFVAKGKPTAPLTVAFLQWILTTGQQYVGEAGYVRLSDDRIESELHKLNP